MSAINRRVRRILRRPVRRRTASARAALSDAATRSPATGIAPALFVLATLLGLAFHAAIAPRWMFGGGMWAEMATNYYPAAQAGDWRTVVLSTDFGYLSLPLRAIAYVGHLVGIAPARVPLYDTLIASVGLSAMLSTFCLPAFRRVVPDDLLRFAASCAMLVSSDFATRTFVNFLYGATLFVALVGLLACADRTRDVPRWAWLCAGIVVSKPAVLAALPSLLLATCVNRGRRLRAIAATCTALALVQVGYLVVNRAASEHDGPRTVSLARRLAVGVRDGLAGFVHFATGPERDVPARVLWIGGAILLATLGAIAWHARGREEGRATLVVLLVFVPLAYFNAALHVLSFGDLLPTMLDGGLDQHLIAQWWSWVMILAAFCMLGEAWFAQRVHWARRLHVGAVALVAAVALAGWPRWGVGAAMDPPSPMTGNSRWVDDADALARGDAPLCVPVDPYGWVGGRRCQSLNPRLRDIWADGVRYVGMDATASIGWHALPLTLKPASGTVDAIGLLVRTRDDDARPVDATIRLNGADATQARDRRSLPPSGGLLSFALPGPIAAADLARLEIRTDRAVDIGLVHADGRWTPGLLWMGEPASGP